MTPFVHPQALCETVNVGDRTRIWAFAHVLPGAVIGADCNLCDHVFVENDVVVGSGVTVKSGVQLWDGVRIGDEVFIGPNATFTNDRFPRSRQRPERFPLTVVHRRASIGANATILPGIEIGEAAMVGAGSVVTRSVPAHAIVAGNPARITGYADVFDTGGAVQRAEPPTDVGVSETAVYGVTFHRFVEHRDLRGTLAAGSFDVQSSDAVPFSPRRWFIVYDVPSVEVRGGHAHKECDQFLVCVNGSIAVVADDARRRQEFILDRPSVGLYIPCMTWATQYKYTNDAVLLVFASHPYDAADYIRNYPDFISSQAVVQRGNDFD